MSDPRRRLRSGTRTAVAVALTLAAFPLLAGCSDDDAPSDSSQSQESAPEATASPSEDTDPSEPGPTDEATVQPATGSVLAPKTGGIRIRIPANWTLDERQASFLVNASGPGSRGRIFVSSFPALDPEVKLNRLARASADTGGYRRSSIRPHVEVGNRLAYHLKGDAFGSPQEEFGTIIDGDILSIEFHFDRIPKDDRPVLVQSVLATVEWG
jgi:hypothetical protein